MVAPRGHRWGSSPLSLLECTICVFRTVRGAYVLEPYEPWLFSHGEGA